jgi:allantoate deiminase/N-carbamoyl-L-amino-acid hydrolase
MNINHLRLENFFTEMSKIGKSVKQELIDLRILLTKKAFELASSWMKFAGMTTRIDNFGNLIGRLEGTNPDLPVLMVGSHLDSQPYGGRYDGVAGVLCAIEAAITMQEKGLKSERTLEIISFADEEGWRFNKGLFGS